jgi:hypothetical protein
VTANAPSFIGNIGVRSAIVDTSRLFELAGAKVHLLSTGPFKAIGVPGTKVTAEQIEHFQGLVDRTFDLFKADVSSGRHLSGEGLDAVLDGKTYIAGDALAMGLIDEVADAESILEGGSSTMAAEQEHSNMFSQFADFLRGSKLRVVPESTVEAIPGQAAEFVTAEVRPIRTYEDGLRAGIDVARKEALAIMQLCMLADKRNGFALACEYIKTGASQDDVREALAEKIALRASVDEDGQEIPEINTGRVAPTSKPKAVLKPASEMAAERDRMALEYGRNLR